ncbi:hypothetical protein [Cohnella thermotolerans]|uniref:hypothetical protein n=1 Tax=Cohnella thermotolerans TaxID=329858 RepID=UPI00040DE68B|nr:hypothetical protein [Cohnella thermotolerans]
MRRWGKARLLLTVICACFLLAGCKSMTMEEAFRKSYPDEDCKILYSQPTADGELAFFRSAEAGGTEGIGLAVFEGDSRTGWRMTQSGSFSYPGRTIVDIGKVNLGSEGEKDVIYGYTDEPDVASIEVADRDGNVIEAHIVDTEWKKIWYAVANIDSLNLKVISSKGDVVYQVPSPAGGNADN